MTAWLMGEQDSIPYPDWKKIGIQHVEQHGVLNVLCLSKYNPDVLPLQSTRNPTSKIQFVKLQKVRIIHEGRMFTS